MKKLVFALWIVIVMLLAAAPLYAQDAHTLTIFAASSLTDAFNDIADVFKAEHPGVEIVFNFGGSSTLSTQIVEGAPADVFASANIKQMQVVCDAGLVAGEPQIFARNRLVVITPSDNPGHIISLGDLATPGLRLVLAAPDVPVRTYTDTMLDLLAADPSYGTAYRDAVLANLVSEEENVRLVASKVALGEADAGVVYASDVTPDIQEEVAVIDVPDAYNTIAQYPIATLSESAEPELAAAFVDFTLSDNGQAILTSWNLIAAHDQTDEMSESMNGAETTPEAQAAPDAESTADAAASICG